MLTRSSTAKPKALIERDDADVRRLDLQVDVRQPKSRNAASAARTNFVATPDRRDSRATAR